MRRQQGYSGDRFLALTVRSALVRFCSGPIAVTHSYPEHKPQPQGSPKAWALT